MQQRWIASFLSYAPSVKAVVSQLVAAEGQAQSFINADSIAHGARPVKDRVCRRGVGMSEALEA